MTWRPNPRSEATERSRKPPPAAKNSREKMRKGSRPTLTQKIKELERKFDQQSTELKTAMLEYRVAAESGKKAEPPRYYGGLSRTNSQETHKLPAHVEARLTILRTRERAAAHDMRDMGKSMAARDAAELEWARARKEAERLERSAPF